MINNDQKRSKMIKNDRKNGINDQFLKKIKLKFKY